MEWMVRTYADRLADRDDATVQLHRCWARPRAFVVPKLVAHFARRRPHVELGNLDVVRDFSDVRAVAQAYVRLLDGGCSGRCDEPVLRRRPLTGLDTRPVDASCPATS